MGEVPANAKRTERTIENLDDRKNPSTNGGEADKHGRETPNFGKDRSIQQTTGALSHEQISGLADIAEDGTVAIDESETDAAKKKPA
jgi:hypothetical protein